MTCCTKENVKAFLVKKYSAKLAYRGITADQVPDNFDFREQGILDSLGILDMISDVENEFNLVLDMEKLEAEKLAVIGAFCEYAANACKPPATPIISPSPGWSGGLSLEPFGFSGVASLIAGCLPIWRCAPGSAYR